MIILGLILNFIGALILVIGSSIQTGVITKIINVVADKYGTWSMGKIPEELIKKFRKHKNLSFLLNFVGYLLFIGGFGFQIIGLVKTCP